MKDKEKLYENLVNFLKLFKNRPHHLAKYLIDNNSLSEDFSNKIVNSKIEKHKLPQFKNISEITEFFNSIIEPILIDGKTPRDLSIQLSKKLNDMLDEERYEEAILIRDYMNDNNIPRI